MQRRQACTNRKKTKQKFYHDEISSNNTCAKMSKRDARNVTKEGLGMDMDPKLGLCSLLPQSPTKSLNPKKICTEKTEMGEEVVSNADIKPLMG